MLCIITICLLSYLPSSSYASSWSVVLDESVRAYPTDDCVVMLDDRKIFTVQQAISKCEKQGARSITVHLGSMGSPSLALQSIEALSNKLNVSDQVFLSSNQFRLKKENNGFIVIEGSLGDNQIGRSLKVKDCIREIVGFSIFRNLDQLKKSKPLVHSITNFVVMEFNANVLLSLGASPIMAHAIEEIEEMVSLSDSIVINIGTLQKDWIHSMILACKSSKKKKKPVVFDPVGVGFTKYRDQTAKEIIDSKAVRILRGNASEIAALCGLTGHAKGVDSTLSPQLIVEDARELSRRLSCVVVISGDTDYIVSPHLCMCLENGDEMMSKITGMGCSATAVIGAFAASDSLKEIDASLCGMACMGIAGTLTRNSLSGEHYAPGSFRKTFIDQINQLTEEKIKRVLSIKLHRMH